ncbi:unnamed protein product [Phytophthora fragariaefolia]|uniref:Unnamed protein product n=1 Tax=Phytophthora fragariaefolia TaxID=1490495 RepID=A0A9W7D5R1_9STRA|nr:unnamed protein product [Phytophthora fragariaefolia]
MFFHLSAVETTSNEWFAKVEPFASQLKQHFETLYIPGSNASVDEMMIRCSAHTVRKKNKPISEGYKVIALCAKGYCFTFDLVSRVVASKVPKCGSLSTTGCIVAHLCSKLPRNMQFNVFMDNYFSSIPLFEHLRSVGIGAYGTAQSNSAKYPKEMRFRNDKTKSTTGTLNSMAVGKVLVIFWMDNGPVQILSTIHHVEGGHWFIERETKRPRTTSTNGASVQRQFDASDRKTFAIPCCVDDYNHYMVGVDIADQYRAYYATQLFSYRTWVPIFFWLLDTTIINALCSRAGKNPLNHRDFRQELSRQLITQTNCAQGEPVQLMHLPSFQQQRVQCALCIKNGVRLQTTVVCAACSCAALVIKTQLLCRVPHSGGRRSSLLEMPVSV